MVAQDASGAPLFRCSGTLVDSTHYLTAGHCTDDAAHVEIWFDAGPIPVDPGYRAATLAGKTPAEACNIVRTDALVGSGYPCVGQASGTPYTHPAYSTGPFYLNDLGMVVLNAAYATPGNLYGKLPSLNILDTLAARPGENRVTFTTVGYGLQEAYPEAAAWKDVAVRQRMVAQPKLIRLNPVYMTLSNNSNTGGTCFGDSGGPNFIGDSNVVGGVTSFGINPTCAGTSGVYRVDRPDDLTWLATFGLTP
ncbi:trypsin-like serine protease [Deinococcus deserti]|uniref:Putative trypsin-like serine protease n=1 Tax=Deinococcus deserti (strain DSM 17065 / CIP 109153 / LMG 22923 / VCD115) TaxID=546414 RepID=C1D2S0_DEIDV|nr:trypsin-like serine protease [Deinococcus deserti]ACO47709.1 putative trypsin-like serine protease [Deinococcus deserti VCD115]